MRESLIEKLAEISIRVFTWGKTKGIQDLEEISADLNSLASDIAEKEWHTGTPTEDGQYLVAYECVYDCKNKGKIEYFTSKIITHEDGYREYRGRPSDDVWEAVAWQKIEPYEEEK